jgi:excisionase family DNA binding protein
MTNNDNFTERTTLLTVEEASQTLKVHPDNLREYLRNGTIEGIKVGRAWRISQRALIEFIEKNTRKAGQSA